MKVDTSNERNTAPMSGLIHSLKDVASDLLEVGELQAELAKEDAREFLSRIATPVFLLLLGLIMMMATLPVLGFALASALELAFALRPVTAQLFAGAVMSVLAIAMILAATYQLRSAFKTFERSTSELAQNFAWLKSMLRGEKS